MTVKPGSLIRLTKNIYWDGEDCHPPGYLARKGETLVVREVIRGHVSASHTPLTQAFFVEFEEYELSADEATDATPPR